MAATTATFEILDYGSDDGSQWGRTSSEKIGHHGVTPVTQYTSVGQPSTYIVYSQSSATATTFGFASADSMSSFLFQMSTVITALRRSGLVA